jgi:peptide/nickel transport system ATP-binding protein
MEMNSPPALLDIRGLNVRFPNGAAVKDFNLTVQRNEVVALVGESGCGKSMTASAIIRLLPRKAGVSGQILFDGEDLLTLPERRMQDLRGNRISMIFQEPMTSLNPVLSIGRQIEEVLQRHQKLSGRLARARAIELLDLVRIAEPQRRVDDYPHNLSGGQRQRVMIAMAVASGPALLIADEPTTALDVTIQAQILSLLDSLRKQLSMSLLLITHDLGVVGQWADRVAVMYDGRKVEDGTRDEVFFRPAHAYTRGLLNASLHIEQGNHYTDVRLAEIRNTVDPVTGERDFTFIGKSRRSTVSADNTDNAENAIPNSRNRFSEAAASEKTPVLAVQNLVAQYSSRYGTISAVKDVSFQIYAGETVGLVGESGCGKSTLSKTIIRLIPTVQGQILLDGVDIAHLQGSALRPHRSKVQIVFQDPYASLNPRMRVNDILDEVLIVHHVRDRNERRRRIAAIIDAVGLPSTVAQRYPHEFSGGQRQRIGIARALILRPKLVICDEPVSALDVSVRAQILNLFVDLKAQFGLSYLFISHDLSVINYIADKVLVMQAGKIVDNRNYSEIWTESRHPYTRSLLSAVPAMPKPAGLSLISGGGKVPNVLPGEGQTRLRVAEGA